MTHAHDEPIVGRVLHTRLLAGDPLVREEIFLRYHGLLVDYLGGYVRRKLIYSADEDAVLDASVEALANYLTRPEQYDPTRGKSLAGYLEMSAVGDLKNALTRDRRPENVRFVGIEELAGNELIDEAAEGAAEVESAIAFEELWDRIAVVAEDDDERTVLDSMFKEERRTEVYAAALGWSELPPSEQARRVNQIKDRLSKRLKRRFAEEPADGYAD